MNRDSFIYDGDKKTSWFYLGLISQSDFVARYTTLSQNKGDFPLL